MAELFVVDDEAELRELLAELLEARGHRVTALPDAAAFRARAAERRPDLVVLDVNMPGEDGIALARWVREHLGCGIVMLTAAGTVFDRIVGLEVGADDYVTKPFSLMELLARVGAVLRRVAPGPGSEPETLRFGDVEIDFARQEARKDGRPVELPTRAYAILKVFARSPGEVVSRERLLEEAWGYDRAVNTRTVDNHMVKLRQALEDAPDRPRHLITVHGAGYKLQP